MDLTDRNLLKNILSYLRKGKVYESITLIEDISSHFAQPEIVERFQNLLENNQYNKVINDIQVYIEMYPQDKVLVDIKNKAERNKYEMPLWF